MSDVSGGHGEADFAASGDKHVSNSGGVALGVVSEEHARVPKGMSANANSHPQNQNVSHGPVNEAQRQLAYADIVLLNKTDLVSQADLIHCERAIRQHNSTVKVRLSYLSNYCGENLQLLSPGISVMAFHSFLLPLFGFYVLIAKARVSKALR
jgi:hypothetical protein